MMTHYTKITWWWLFSLILVGCQAAKPPFECQDKLGCVTIAPNQPIKVGVLQDLSGSAKGFGELQVQLVELALAEKNNTLLGHPIEMVKFDENCSAEGGANAMLKYMADPQIVAVLGPTCSAAAVGAGPGLDQSGLVMISGMSSAAALTSVAGQQGADWHAGFFRTITNGSLQGHTIAVFAFEKLGLRRIGVVNSGDTYTVGLTDAFKKTFTELGGEVVAEGQVNRGDTDMKPILASIAKASPEGIFMGLFQAEGLALYQQAPEVTGLEQAVFFSNSALLGDFLLQDTVKKNNPLYLVDISKSKTSAIQSLLERYTAKYGKPQTSFYSFSYDATALLVNTLEQVMLKEEDGTLHLGRQALRDALYNTKDFEAAAGKLSCDKFGDCGVSVFDVLQVESSAKTLDEVKANVVYTYDPQQK